MSERAGGSGGLGGGDLTCREVVEFLSEYVEGGLGEGARRVFDEHLAGCPCCTAYLESFRRVIALGRRAGGGEGLGLPPAPKELIEAIVSARPV